MYIIFEKGMASFTCIFSGSFLSSISPIGALVISHLYSCMKLSEDPPNWSEFHQEMACNSINSIHNIFKDQIIFNRFLLRKNYAIFKNPRTPLFTQTHNNNNNLEHNFFEDLSFL